MPASPPNTGSSAIARLPTEVDIASEFRYREAPLPKNGLAIVVSQSGETADTLAALRYCKSQGQHTLAIVNVPESTIARESEMVFRTYAGPEIGVASTKAFTCQLTALACLAILAGKLRGTITAEQERELVGALIMAPRQMTEILKEEKHIADVAREIANARDVLFLGRGINYPIALEGALKLKEISYIHAEGYAAGELKHGPIALIDENVPVIVIAPHDELYDKTISNMEEVAARGGKIVLLTDDHGMKDNEHRAFRTIRVPKAHPLHQPAALCRAGAAAGLSRRRVHRAPTSTSRATWRSPSPWSDRLHLPQREEEGERCPPASRRPGGTATPGDSPTELGHEPAEDLREQHGADAACRCSAGWRCRPAFRPAHPPAPRATSGGQGRVHEAFGRMDDEQDQHREKARRQPVADERHHRHDEAEDGGVALAQPFHDRSGEAALHDGA